MRTLGVLLFSERRQLPFSAFLSLIVRVCCEWYEFLTGQILLSSAVRVPESSDYLPWRMLACNRFTSEDRCHGAHGMSWAGTNAEDMAKEGTGGLSPHLRQPRLRSIEVEKLRLCEV